MEMSDDLTIREKFELAYNQIVGPERRLGKITFEWPDKGPMSFVTAGRPVMAGPFVLVILLIVYLVAVQIVNWDLTMRLAADPFIVSEIDWRLIEMINAPVPYVLFFTLLIGGYMAAYLHLNTWGDFLYQVEPALIDTLEGEVKQPVLRLQESEPIWPPIRGSKYENWIAELEEELLVEELEWDKISELPSLKEAVERDGRKDERKDKDGEETEEKAESETGV